MKKILLLSLSILALVFSGCDDDDDGGKYFKINVPAIAGDTKEVDRITYQRGSDIVSECKFSASGFTVKLPATFGTADLYDIKSTETPDITVSNKNAKWSSMIVLDALKSDTFMGFLRKFYSDTEKRVVTEYVYCSEDVTVGGKVELDYVEEVGGHGYQRVYIFDDIVLKKGWNVVYSVHRQPSDDVRTITYVNSATETMEWGIVWIQR